MAERKVEMTSREYAVHPFAARFPMMSDEELEELATDIRERGQREAIWLSFDGTTILDGRNRLAACRLLGLEPKTKRINSRMSEVDVIELIVSNNIKRRHLTQGQRAMLVLDAGEELARLVAERAPKTRHNERGPQGTFVPADQSGVKGSTSPDRKSSNRTRPMVAAVAGVSEWSIGVASRLVEHAPELAERVRKGELALNTARREMLDAHPELSRDTPKEEAMWLPPQGNPPPAGARSPLSRKARIAWIRYMAKDSATSFQIGEKLGIHPFGIRKLAKDAGIEIPADKHALRKKQPTFNVDAAVGLLISDLEVMPTTIERIQSAATDLDPSKVEAYADSLNQLRKRINSDLTNLVKELRKNDNDEV